MAADVLALVRELVIEVYEREVNLVDVNSRFNEDLDMDSLDVVAVVADLEQALGVALAVDQLADVATVGQVVDLADEALAADAADGVGARR